MAINGHTRLFAILADPIAQVRAPEIFNALFARDGTDAVLVPMHVGADALAGVWQGLRRLRNLGGLIVTVPHKSAVLALCEEAGTAARQVGAANVVRREADGRMVCEMFDGRGFLAGLEGQGHAVAGRRVLLVGAGGAAAAIAFALAGAGVAALTIANRTAAKAEDLARRVTAAYPACRAMAGPADPDGHDIVVNATSLGLRADDPLPLDAERLAPDMLVAEVIMKPETTPLLARAEAAGCRLHHGRHMLDSQVALLAEFLGAGPEGRSAAAPPQ